MKPKYLIIGLCMIILVSSVIAITDLKLSQKQINRIKLSSNVPEINVKISEINCNENECWSKVSQKGVINTEWRRSKSYCSEMLDCINKTNCTSICIKQTEYTTEENKLAAKEYRDKRLGNYADAEEQRHNNKEIIIINNKEEIKEKDLITEELVLYSCGDVYRECPEGLSSGKGTRCYIKENQYWWTASYCKNGWVKN